MSDTEAMMLDCVQATSNGVDDEGASCACCQRRFDKAQGNPDYFERFGLKIPTIAERIAAAVAEEREACAVACESMGWSVHGATFAAAIRARGKS